jgi:hypothetical protein
VLIFAIVERSKQKNEIHFRNGTIAPERIYDAGYRIHYSIIE